MKRELHICRQRWLYNFVNCFRSDGPIKTQGAKTHYSLPCHGLAKILKPKKIFFAKSLPKWLVCQLAASDKRLQICSDIIGTINRWRIDQRSVHKLHVYAKN